MWERIIKGAAMVAGAITGLYGGWGPMLTVLLVMMCIDYVTGVLVAVTGRSDKTEGGGLSSKAGFIGLAKKGFIMLIILLATLLDRAAGNSVLVFQTAAACYYIANEGLSILENAARMGIPFPEALRTALEGMKQKENAEK